MVIAILFFAASGYLLWLSWSLYWVSVSLFFVGTCIALYKLVVAGKRVLTKSRIFSLGVFLLLASHLVGVFLPETGFDAVWYHLPITEVFVSTQHTEYIPQLYQSAMPRLGSYLFVIPYMFAGVIGVKVFVYFLGLIFLYQVYCLSRIFVKKNTAYLFMLVFLSFHTVAWQMSSAYVDIMRATFEITAFLFLLKTSTWKGIGVSAFLFGLALCTKLVALLFLPVWMIYLCIEKGWKKTLFWMVCAFIVYVPWMIQSFMWTGNPVFPLFDASYGLELITYSGYSSLFSWVLGVVSRIPLIPFLLSIHMESYTTPFFFFSYPFLLLAALRWNEKKKKVLVFASLFLVFLFSIPPVSIRYALSGIVIFLILCFSAVEHRMEHSPLFLRIVLFVCILGIVVNMSIRVGSHATSLPYLLGKETQDAYITRYSQGIQKGPMDLWYSGYFKTYGK